MSIDITSNYHGGNSESIAAKALSENTASAQRMRITDLANRCGEKGVTCDEAEIALRLSHQSCSARFSELKRAGTLFPGALKRKTRQGASARVLYATQALATSAS